MDKENHFDQVAAEWDEDPQKLALSKDIAAAIAAGIPLDEDMKALEFGCGTGLIGLLLASSLGHLTAMDSSEEMLKVLGEKLETGKFPNVEVEHADVTADGVLPRQFDLIFSGMVLHHIPDPDELLARFAAHIPSGGWLAIADLDLEDGSFHPEHIEIFHKGFERDDLIQRIEAAGFKVQQAQTVHTFRRELEIGIHEYPVFTIIAQRC